MDCRHGSNQAYSLGQGWFCGIPSLPGGFMNCRSEEWQRGGFLGVGTYQLGLRGGNKLLLHDAPVSYTHLTLPTNREV